MARLAALFTLALALVALAPATGRATALPGNAGAALEGTFVGRVTVGDGNADGRATRGSPKAAHGDVFVALVVKRGRVVAYICNGREIAQWFRGRIRNGKADLRAGGFRLRISLAKARGSGTLTVTDGTSNTFTVRAARGRAGLYRAEFELGGRPYVGAWVVLPSGEQRGFVGCFPDTCPSDSDLAGAGGFGGQFGGGFGFTGGFQGFPPNFCGFGGCFFDASQCVGGFGLSQLQCSVSFNTFTPCGFGCFQGGFGGRFAQRSRLPETNATHGGLDP